MAEERPDPDGLRRAAREAKAEAQRLREKARELERKLRAEAREQRKRERAEERARRQAERRNGGPDRGRPGKVVSEKLDLEGIRRVTIHQTAGHLTVEACAEDEPAEVTTAADRTAPAMTITRSEDALLIDIKLAMGWLFRRRRGAASTVKLPPGLESLSLEVGAGDIHVRGVSARRIKASTGAGVVNMTGSRGAVDAHTGAGRLAIYSHHGLVRCGTGTGDAVVDVAEAQPGAYLLDVGLGRADLRLPPGLQVHAAVRSGLGRGRLEYPNAAPDAPITASVTTGIGDAVVRERKPAPEPSPPAKGTAQPRSRAAPREAEELRILQLLEQGRITVTEAGELISALHDSPGPGQPAERESSEDG